MVCPFGVQTPLNEDASDLPTRSRSGPGFAAHFVGSVCCALPCGRAQLQVGSVRGFGRRTRVSHRDTALRRPRPSLAQRPSRHRTGRTRMNLAATPTRRENKLFASRNSSRPDRAQARHTTSSRTAGPGTKSASSTATCGRSTLRLWAAPARVRRSETAGGAHPGGIGARVDGACGRSRRTTLRAVLLAGRGTIRAGRQPRPRDPLAAPGADPNGARPLDDQPDAGRRTRPQAETQRDQRAHDCRPLRNERAGMICRKVPSARRLSRRLQCRCARWCESSAPSTRSRPAGRDRRRPCMSRPSPVTIVGSDESSRIPAGTRTLANRTIGFLADRAPCRVVAVVRRQPRDVAILARRVP